YSVATFAAEHACPWGGLDGFEILEAPPELQRQDFRPMAHEYVPGRQPASARGNETPRVPTSSRLGVRRPWWCESGCSAGHLRAPTFSFSPVAGAAASAFAAVCTCASASEAASVSAGTPWASGSSESSSKGLRPASVARATSRS